VRDLLPAIVELPRSLVVRPPLTDAEFEAICLESEFVRYERSREGEILMQAPAGGFTSDGNSEISLQLRTWWKTHRRGRVFDSSCGYFLGDGSMLSPDASYVLPEKLHGLRKNDLTGFPRLCPDFVIELLSPSDALSKAQAKMDRWIENGVTLAWLIDPYQQQVYIYEPACAVRVISGSDVQGNGPVQGFVLDLDALWRCYQI
jgi:Uma2 family endonuclease